MAQFSDGQIREALEAVAAGRVKKGVKARTRGPVEDFKRDEALVDEPDLSLFRELGRQGYLGDTSSPEIICENAQVMPYGFESVWLSDIGKRRLAELRAAN